MIQVDGDPTPVHRLQLLANPKRFTKDSKAKLPGDPGITREDLAKYKAHASNLLTLQVLVQNRRKDGEKALVFGAQSRVISYGNTMDELMRGKTSVLVESVTDFKIEQWVSTSRDVPCIAVC